MELLNCLDELLEIGRAVANCDYRIESLRASRRPWPTKADEIAAESTEPPAQPAQSWASVLWQTRRVLKWWHGSLACAFSALDALPADATPHATHWRENLRRLLIELRDGVPATPASFVLNNPMRQLWAGELNKLIDFARDLEAAGNGEPPTKDGGAAPKRKRAGRRKKREASGEIRVRGALVDWHKYEQGGVGRDDPAALAELADIAECNDSTVSRWLKIKFGGYEQYKAACVRDTLADTLAFWLGELTDEHIKQLKAADLDDE